MLGLDLGMELDSGTGLARDIGLERLRNASQLHDWFLEPGFCEA